MGVLDHEAGWKRNVIGFPMHGRKLSQKRVTADYMTVNRIVALVTAVTMCSSPNSLFASKPVK